MAGRDTFAMMSPRSGATAPSATATPDVASPAARLEELERLHASGTISDEEYALKHADLVRLL